jgi:regulator of protease activity HflC (stomatin/prohibitin superfamily)
MSCSCFCFNTVQTSEIGIVETCGKFAGVRGPGLNCIAFPFQCLVNRMSTRVMELNTRCETKTKDDVFVYVNASIQYQIIQTKTYEAYYILEDVEAQMQAYIFDVIRAHIPLMKLDEAFASKEEVSVAIRQHLGEIMAEYGYQILTALVTDLTPDEKVRQAMNEINASKRQKQAAYQRAEGEKVLKVKKAEAECESMYLSGVGVARQRRAMSDGLKDSIVGFTKGGTAQTKDVMDLLVLNQYFDTLNEIGGTAGAKIIFQDSTKHPITEGVLQANASLGY